MTASTPARSQFCTAGSRTEDEPMCDSRTTAMSTTPGDSSDPPRQRGAVMAEYAFVISLILGVAAIAVGALGVGVNSLFLLFPN